MSKDTDKKPMPRGGRKGGTQFPQINLADAERYCKKLVSKTHNGPQPEAVILPGVFDSATSAGKIRASAMKQYGLMQGEAAAYEATALAKELHSALPEERQRHLQLAFLNAKVFKTIFNTFVDDTISLARIRQQAAQLRVHPDNQDLVTKLFAESATAAGLAAVDGDNITLARASTSDLDNATEEHSAADDGESENECTEDTEEAPVHPENGTGARPARAIINVSVTLDSSLDTDKLGKQLELLRKYGAI